MNDSSAGDLAQVNKNVEKLIALLRDKMLQDNPGQMHRDAHPKQHGILKAEFTILEDIPKELKVGIFSAPAEYEAWLRFSNSAPKSQPDSRKDIRGAAIKVMNVPGRKIALEYAPNLTSQDFLLISSPTFITQGLETFVPIAKAVAAGGIKLGWFLITHPRTAIRILKASKNYPSPLDARYWSATPYSLGGFQVKYSLKPELKTKALAVNKKDKDYMRHNMEKQLGVQDYRLDFCVQLRTDPGTMPLDDLTVEWDESISPFITVAKVTIPKQIFETSKRDEFGRNLSFNPWHALEEHKPLGDINEARRIVYQILSRFRHERNDATNAEPLPTSAK